jgi:hypothetical protein
MGMEEGGGFPTKGVISVVLFSFFGQEAGWLALAGLLLILIVVCPLPGEPVRVYYYCYHYWC